MRTYVDFLQIHTLNKLVSLQMIDVVWEVSGASTESQRRLGASPYWWQCTDIRTKVHAYNYTITLVSGKVNRVEDTEKGGFAGPMRVILLGKR